MMGICLDTDANTAQDTQDPGAEWKGGGIRRGTSIGSASNGLVMQNSSKIKFDPPKVPVIFILGGPGSGKVTHCDTLMHEKRGVTHINMMDLLQQYAIGNDMQDFAQIPSKTVAEVLMLEMKMAPAAKAFLISGYPRSMRDVVEYSEKIQVVNGVILISWRQSVLQKQIDYGAKLGHVVLSLAKMELENFFKNVMPVADYFDQSDLLVAVNGERSPSEVYKDFRAAVFDILEALENQEAILNGVTGMGRGINDIPGSIVSVETAPSQQKNITEMSHLTKQYSTSENIDPTSLMGQNVRSFHGDSGNDIPPVIWVIGGPGSNKGSLCAKAVAMNPGWTHFSVGRLLRAITDTAPRANTESYAVKEALSAGELVTEKAVNALLQKHMGQKGDSKGIIIDGYPRKIEQVKYFETRFKQRPPVILLDCSKLQLGRGRIDDTVSSFRRRLELFREQTLPMLKLLDGNNRLTIVDGDTDSPSVQREFEQVIINHIEQLTGDQPTTSTEMKRIDSTVNQDVSKGETVVEDIEENVPGVVPTVSHHVSLTNGYLKSSTNTHSDHQKSQMNGNIPNGGFNFRQMLNEAEQHSLDTFL